MNSNIYKTEVDLDGLLEVLGKNLYSTPAVALRELIQNAHDACERYRIETGNDIDHRITLTTDTDNSRLTIEDNGSGLTREEITKYLATIGSGYTRVLRNETQSEDMIGYFGLGFLSAYVVAEKVEVVTTSWQTPDQSWLFTSAGGKSFAIGEAPNTGKGEVKIGTTVTLHLAPEFEELANEGVLFSLIQKYCGLLPINIFLNQLAKPINCLQAPWALKETSPLRRKKLSLEFAQIFENDFEPIACINIDGDNHLGLKGVIWIQDGGSYASSDNRNISVFIRNMFITNDERDLIPRWAGFVGAVLESVNFKPTASRESLQTDEFYLAAVDFLREQLISGLRNIVIREPETWQRILTRHNQALLGAAVADERLFDACRKSLKVPTSLGELTLPQVIKQSGGSIFIKPEQNSGFEEILFRAKGIPLVHGYLFGSIPYCKLYGEQENIHVQLLGTDKDENTVFNTTTDVEADLKQCLQQAFHDDLTAIKFARFEPSSIPMILVSDREAQLKKRMESDEAAKRISSAALSLARMHTKTITKDKEFNLYINVNNSLISRFHTMSDARRNHLATLLKSFISVSNHNNAQDGSDIHQAFENFNRSLLAIFEMTEK